MKQLNKLAFIGFASVLSLTANTSALACQAQSWNLSRDMMTGISTNPKGVWSFMQGAAIHDSSSYHLLPTYSSPCNEGNWVTDGLSCWADIDVVHFLPRVSVATKGGVTKYGVRLVKGMPSLHPASDRAAIVRWTSPIDGHIAVSGQVSDLDKKCGDGITWFIDRGNSPIINGSVRNSGEAFSTNFNVVKGDTVNFIVDRGLAQDYECDSTGLDLLITSQQ